MAEHTPGPWQYGSGSGPCEIGGAPVVSASHDGKHRIIASVTCGWFVNTADGTVIDRRDGEAHANARLIAAAPELLAACKLAMDACRDKAHDACKAAIAKAEPPQ